MFADDLLDQLLHQNRFEHYCQPIFNLKNNSIVGGEYLLRSNLGTPDVIFNEARNKKRLYELDIKSIHKAIQSFCSINKRFIKDEYKLFINVFPSTLINHNFPSFIKIIFTEFKEYCQHIIFEINESDSFDAPLLFSRVELLKEYGFLIAFDDVGRGWTTISDIIELDPEFLKLDRYFAIDLHKNKKKQDMINAVLTYCNAENIKLILEGIENNEVLEVAHRLGVHMVQGFYLGRPEKIVVF